MTHPPAIFALFDFDKTIVSRDSGYEFIKHRLNSSVIRRLIAFFVSPIAIFFYLPIRMRFISHSIFMWIATAGLNKKELGIVNFYIKQVILGSPRNRKKYS